MFPPAPAITYTFPATFLTTSSTGDVNLGSSTLLLKPRLSGMGPPVGICVCALAAVPKKTAKISASIGVLIIAKSEVSVSPRCRLSVFSAYPDTPDTLFPHRRGQPPAEGHTWWRTQSEKGSYRANSAAPHLRVYRPLPRF